MAKKLIATYYSFSADSDKITVPGFYRQEQFLLITDVKSGNIIYNFADPTKGATDAVFDAVDETTTITLETSMSAFGIDSTAKLQILVDHPEQEVEVSDSLLDPVHKIRVSNPQNLIDTDFEYGLQPTKWETLELANNVPSFYVGDGDIPLGIIDKVESTAGSNNILVTCNDAHGLVVGTPIDVNGLDARTAEGKFIISAADSATFSYKANNPQVVTGEIGSIYTSITPGSFYAGSQIPYALDTGLTTDEQAPSNITVTTNDKHGFVPKMNFYLINSVGGKKLNITNTSSAAAPDNAKYVEHENTTVKNVTPDLTKTHTTQIRGAWSHYFSSSDVDTSANTINWPNHNLRTNYCLLYNPPAGGAQIGGLARFDIYYVRYVDANTIQLSQTYNGSAINFSSGGDTSHSEHNLHLVYEVRRSYAPYANSWTYHYTWSHYYGANASGYDMATYTNGSYGLGSQPYGHMMMVRQYNYPSDSQRWLSYYTPEYHQYNSAYSNQTYWRFPEYDPSAAANEPSRWNPIEDFSRFSTFNWRGYRGPIYNSRYFLNQKYYYTGTYDYYWSNRRVFMFPFQLDNESDSFYSQGHGLLSGSTAAVSTTSGSQIRISNSNTNINNTNTNSNLSDGNYAIEVVSEDRFRLQNNRIVQATGAYSLVGQAENVAANTFYIADHGLKNNETVRFNVEAGGVVPTSSAGTLIPKSETSVTGNNLVVFKALDTAVSDYLLNNMTGHTTFRTASSANSSVIATSGYTSGVSPVNSIRTYYTTYWHYVYVNGSTVASGYPDASKLNVGNLGSNKVVNLFENNPYGYSNMEKYNFNVVASDWTANSDMNYYLLVQQAGDNAWGAGINDYWRGYRYTVSYLSSGGFGLNYTDRRLLTRVVGGKTYKLEYAFATKIENGRAAVHVKAIMGNTSNWDTYGTGDWNVYRPSNNSTYEYFLNTGVSKNAIEFDLWFFGTGSLQATNTTQIDNLMYSIIDDFDANFQAATLTNGAEYQAVVIDNNRFRVAQNNNVVDITTSGTSPLSFEVTEVLGAADGAYSVETADDYSFTLSTPFEVSGNSEILNSALIDSDYNIPISGGHPFITGTSVEYTQDPGGVITNLSNGSTYYVGVVDENTIQLFNDQLSAQTGQDPIAVEPSVLTSHKIKTTSVAGQVAADGLVSVTAGSKTINGTLTLFKRYFKIGDIILIKDNNTTPGSLEEFTITAIADDESLEVNVAPTFTAVDTKHFVRTNVFVKPDGYSIHRPFDGGVEIGAGTSPYAQITRQTRKYFRYQSGKGIQTSLAINFNPPTTFESLTSNGTTARARTKNPHRLAVGQAITVSNATDDSYNGDFTVTSIVDDYNYTFTLPAAAQTTIPGGIIQYVLQGYSGAYTRAGMFDSQNGFFFEYDGTTLSCCRRSSTTQLSGTAKAVKNSGLIEGTGTNFTGQLAVRDKVVIRGQTYTIVSIENRTQMYVQPQYRGVSADGIILTKTETVKVPQNLWNLDKCDGSGLQGFVLDKTKIQMAYMDYSWYGAGKIRFGFKDRKGHVRYVHEFIHNNRLDEAYMRSGNLPAKYEIENDINPTFAPSLFHWGTSVIMDGRFDEDEAYLFTAPSQALSFTNGQSNTATTTSSSSITYSYNRGTRQYDFYVRIPFNSNDASKFSSGIKLYTADNTTLTGEEVSYTNYSGSTFYANIYVSSGRSFPAVGTYPSVSSGTVVNVGAPASGGSDVALGTATIPLVSLRLAPSVDNNLTGNLGERDIINRMQLKLQEIGLILTHDCEVKLILNGDISTVGWGNVASPSLSQLIKHNSGDQVTGGTEVFSFRAAGGSTDNTGKRLSNTSNFRLDAIIDMGNSILGGDGTFPNGPDILTVAVQVTDTAGINASSPFAASARITWAESQA